MSLLAIIISLLVERYYQGVERLRHYGWFDRFCTWAARHFKSKPILDGPVGLIAILVPAVAAVGLVQDYLTRASHPLGYLFAIVVLIYCLGPKTLRPHVVSYINARNNDDREGARDTAAALIGGVPPEGTEALDKAVLETVLTETNDRLLTVVFWFFILGPIGAVVYRLTHLLVRDAAREDGFGVGLIDAALRLRGILDWVPARLTAWGYALMGDFAGARHNWQIRAFEWLDNWVEGNRGVLIASGTGALKLPADLPGQADLEAGHACGVDTITAALDLAGRTVLTWLALLALLALLTLAGWSIL